ncbi:hypothetical protein CRG98_031193 [Punica granatum]|uniref:Uncharacterized protein n=1 Tax=Punica granatum TaxID=22663 RepID=A0A2I0IWQ4_PUNGR|nr:hypothetical protein CRG98_031193 [Punica granatum]
MAKKDNLLSAIVTLLIICGAIFVEAKPIPPPWVGKHLPPEPVKGLWKFLRQCGRTLTNEYGQMWWSLRRLTSHSLEIGEE